MTSDSTLLDGPEVAEENNYQTPVTASIPKKGKASSSRKDREAGASHDHPAEPSRTTKALDENNPKPHVMAAGASQDANDPAAEVPQSQLSEAEQDRLKVCEVTIEENKDAIKDVMPKVAQVADALFEIQSNGLYKASHKSFEAYCKERWGFHKSYAYYLIKFREVTTELSTIVDGSEIELNEGQTRALASAPPGKRGETLKAAQAQASAEGVDLAAKHIKSQVEAKYGKKTRNSVKKEKTNTKESEPKSPTAEKTEQPSTPEPEKSSPQEQPTTTSKVISFPANCNNLPSFRELANMAGMLYNIHGNSLRTQEFTNKLSQLHLFLKAYADAEEKQKAAA